jgi:hypothetical protein
MTLFAELVLGVLAVLLVLFGEWHWRCYRRMKRASWDLKNARPGYIHPKDWDDTHR